MTPLLQDRVAVVTGAGSGIGAATATLLARAGSRVACVDVNADAAAATAAAIKRDEPGHASPHVADVSSREQVMHVVDSVAADWGKIDVMANVAGIIRNGSVLDTTEAELDAVWEVNFKGVLWGCQAAGRHMAEQGSGVIVNMASAAIDSPSPGLVCYATAKAAVAQLTRTLAAELGAAGVRVNAIAPGFIDTSMTQRHFVTGDGTVDESRRDELHGAMRRMSPLGITGEPSDIAEAVVYLASDAARFVTGQVLRVNGGVAMPL